MKVKTVMAIVAPNNNPSISYKPGNIRHTISIEMTEETINSHVTDFEKINFSKQKYANNIIATIVITIIPNIKI